VSKKTFTSSCVLNAAATKRKKISARIQSCSEATQAAACGLLTPVLAVWLFGESTRQAGLCETGKSTAAAGGGGGAAAAALCIIMHHLMH
jgi:hypothetical protein